MNYLSDHREPKRTTIFTFGGAAFLSFKNSTETKSFTYRLTSLGKAGLYSICSWEQRCRANFAPLCHLPGFPAKTWLNELSFCQRRLSSSCTHSFCIGWQYMENGCFLVKLKSPFWTIEEPNQQLNWNYCPKGFCSEIGGVYWPLFAPSAPTHIQIVGDLNSHFVSECKLTFSFPHENISKELLADQNMECKIGGLQSIGIFKIAMTLNTKMQRKLKHL